MTLFLSLENGGKHGPVYLGANVYAKVRLTIGAVKA